MGHYAAGVVPGDGIFTTWNYRAGAGRAEAFLLNPQPLAARTAYEWGVVAEVVPNGKALSRALELAALYLKAPEVTRRDTRVHFIQPLKAHRAGSWLWTVARRSVVRRSREINASQERTCGSERKRRVKQAESTSSAQVLKLVAAVSAFLTVGSSFPEGRG